MTYTAPSGSHAPIPHGDLMESDEHDRLAQELEQQLALLKDPDERRQLTSPDSLHSHVACAKRLLASPSGYGSAVKLRCWLAMQQLATGRKLCMCCRCRSRALLLQLRLLRNCVALEPEVAGPGLLDTGLLEHVPQAVQALSAAEGEFFKGQRLLQGSSHVALFETCACSALKGSQDALVALAQLLANWAGSPEAATQMQAVLFPQAWYALVACHSGKHARDSCPAQVLAGTPYLTHLALPVQAVSPSPQPSPCTAAAGPALCSVLSFAAHPASWQP